MHPPLASNIDFETPPPGKVRYFHQKPPLHTHPNISLLFQGFQPTLLLRPANIFPRMEKFFSRGKGGMGKPDVFFHVHFEELLRMGS